MNQENNNFKFNTDLLMNDVNNVIQNGINNLLSDFITNYKLYEETHNCIMNLPSIKREFAKKKFEEGYDYLMDYSSVKTQFSSKNEAYDDLPDLISVSSYENVKGIEESFCDNYTRIPIEEVIEDDSDQESDDTILCMKKIANQLLKEKEDTYALFQKETNSYKEIIENCYKEIENCYKEIENLKNEINELKNSSIVCDLTVDGEDTQELIVEIKQEKEKEEEKENIVLHMEEQSGTEEETDSEVIEEDDSESVEEEEHDSEVVEEEPDSEVVEEEEEQEKSDFETEKSDEDTVETEKSDEKDFVEEEEEEEEEEELIEIEIDDVTYCTNDENNGLIYELDKDGNVGETVGYLKDGEPFFN